MRIAQSCTNALHSSCSVPEGLRLGLAAASELAEIKALDDLAFGLHQGITYAELEMVLERGCIITLRECRTNTLVGQSQLLLTPDADDPYCPSSYGYCYGTAIVPAYHRRQLGGLLAQTQELVARQAQCQGLFLSARLENAASLRLRLNQGFLISGCAPNFYGEGEAAARVLLTKAFTQSLIGSSDHVHVPVRFGDSSDPAAFKRTRQLLHAGKLGIGVDAEGVLLGLPYFAQDQRAAAG